MTPRRRKAIDSVRPIIHGALSGAEAERIIDFSASLNPFGPSPGALTALSRIDPLALGRYPDDGARGLRAAIASRLGAFPDQTIIGNGSSELILLVALAFLEADDQAIILGPTFGEYERVARIMGAGVHQIVARKEDDFRPDLEDFALALTDVRPKLAFLCNPNNPTGHYIGESDLTALVRSFPETLFVVDEAYAFFVESAWRSEELLQGPTAARNLLILRSLTKEHALAGLRVGYALGHPDVIESLTRVRPPWSVNCVAQTLALASLEDTFYRDECRRKLRASKSTLVVGLRNLGYRVIAGEANFALVEVGDGAAFRAALLRGGVCVRDCESFGLSEFVRIGVRDAEETKILLQTICGLESEERREQ